MSLFCLSHYSPAGYREANAIVGKLLKSVSDDRRIHNPPAYVAKSVKEARHKLNPSGGVHAGMGGYESGDPRLGCVDRTS